MSTITLLSPEIIEERTQAGLILPGGLVDQPENRTSSSNCLVIDCGDDRELTSESFVRRQQSFGPDVLTEGHFGGVVGLEVVHLAALTAMHGASWARKQLDMYDGRYFSVVPAESAARLKQSRIIANTHSDEASEGNPLLMQNTPGLGCAFNVKLLDLLRSMTTDEVLADAEALTSAADIKMPLLDAQSAVSGLFSVISERDKIDKASLAQNFRRYQAPAAVILAGSHASPADAQIYVSFDPNGTRTHNFRHNLVGKPRYTHSVTLPERVLPYAHEEEVADKSILSSLSLLACVATANALRGGQSGLPYEVIR